MSRNIGQKKRFEVLQRDGFACKYCGQKPPFVQLEVDHIVPRSNGGTNEINNLITACFNCNRGKGSNGVRGDTKNLYKTKINDAIYKCKTHFYKIRNEANMGSIDEKTRVLLSMWTKNNFNRQDMIYIKAHCAVDKTRQSESIENYQELTSKFMLGGLFCDNIINETYNGIIDTFTEYYIKEILDDSNWKGDDNYSRKLNYQLTEDMNNYIKPYVLIKYTLFPNLLSDG